MFDIGLPELILVSIVALLVIGPERLPETIRAIMLWLGRIRRTFTNIKTELEQEIGADEIRRQIHNEGILNDIRESKEKIQDALKDADQSIDEFKHSIQGSLEDTAPKTHKAQPNQTQPNQTVNKQPPDQQQDDKPPLDTPDSPDATSNHNQQDDSKDDEPERRTH